MSDDMFYCSFVSIHYIICECGETFPTEEDLKNHLEKEHAQKKEKKEYKCGICESLFSTEEECIEHYEQSHIEVKLESPEDSEDVIYEDVKDDGILVQEILYDSSQLLDEVTIESKDARPAMIVRKRGRKPKSFYNIKNIVCEVCGKRYASNAALRYHQRVHTGERPYKCTMCPKCFTMPLFLQIHLRTHTGERPYECQLCPKAFSNKAALLRHDRVHTGIKPYECPECGKFFTQSNSMKLHVNTVHLKMPAPYKSKNRKLKAKEREMMRLHAGSGDRTLEDSVAVESISQSSNLAVTDLNVYIKPQQNQQFKQEDVPEQVFKEEAPDEDLYEQEEVPEQDLYEQEEVQETQILYEDVDAMETYEVIYDE